MDIDKVLNKLYDLPVKVVESYKPNHIPVSEFIRVSCLYGGKKFVHFMEIASYFDRYIGDIRLTKALLRDTFNKRSSFKYAPYYLIVVPMTYHRKPTYAVLTEQVGGHFRLRPSKCYYVPNWRYLVKFAAYHQEDLHYFNLLTFPQNGQNWILKRFQSTKSIAVPVPILDLWIEHGLDHLVAHFMKCVYDLIADYES